MSRQWFKQIVGAVLAGTLLFALPEVTEGASEPLPNIVFILTDDQGYGDLGLGPDTMECLWRFNVKTVEIQKTKRKRTS